MRKPCPFCTRKHLASARRVLWELPAHGDDVLDPHLEILIADLEHAEQQSPYPQLTERIRVLKKIFDDKELWTTAQFMQWTADNQFDWDAKLVSLQIELRELVDIERIKHEKATKGDQEHHNAPGEGAL